MVPVLYLLGRKEIFQKYTMSIYIDIQYIRWNMLCVIIEFQGYIFARKPETHFIGKNIYTILLQVVLETDIGKKCIEIDAQLNKSYISPSRFYR